MSKTLRRWCVWKKIICSFYFYKLRILMSTSRASTSILAFFSFAHFQSLFLSQIFATFWERGYSKTYKKRKKLFFQNFNFFLKKCSFLAFICCVIRYITIISHEDIKDWKKFFNFQKSAFLLIFWWKIAKNWKNNHFLKCDNFWNFYKIQQIWNWWSSGSRYQKSMIETAFESWKDVF